MNLNDQDDQNADVTSDEVTPVENKGKEGAKPTMKDPSKPIKSTSVTWVELLLLALLCIAIGIFIAPKGNKSENASSITLIQDGGQPDIDEGLIQASIQEIDPSMTVKKITPTTFYGLHEAEVDGGNVLYVNHDGSAIIHGSLFERESGLFVNQTEKVYGGFVRETIAGIDESDFIEYKSDREQTKIVVFTDPGCPYCQKLHEDVSLLNDAGITVRYLPFGRGGPGSESFAVLDSVWCADGRLDALTKAKKGEALPSSDCDSVVNKYYDMGVDLNIRGTPYIFLEDGVVIRGYLPAEGLIQAIDHK